MTPRISGPNTWLQLSDGLAANISPLSPKIEDVTIDESANPVSVAVLEQAFADSADLHVTADLARIAASYRLLRVHVSPPRRLPWLTEILRAGSRLASLGMACDLVMRQAATELTYAFGKGHVSHQAIAGVLPQLLEYSDQLGHGLDELVVASEQRIGIEGDQTVQRVMDGTRELAPIFRDASDDEDEQVARSVVDALLRGALLPNPLDSIEADWLPRTEVGAAMNYMRAIRYDHRRQEISVWVEASEAPALFARMYTVDDELSAVAALLPRNDHQFLGAWEGEVGRVEVVEQLDAPALERDGHLRAIVRMIETVIPSLDAGGQRRALLLLEQLNLEIEDWESSKAAGDLARDPDDPFEHFDGFGDS